MKYRYGVNIFLILENICIHKWNNVTEKTGIVGKY